jgi:hypothetical protein
MSYVQRMVVEAMLTMSSKSLHNCVRCCSTAQAARESRAWLLPQHALPGCLEGSAKRQDVSNLEFTIQ